jgi:type I restriction enzyme S subunit
MMKVKLEGVCERGSSNLMQKDIDGKSGGYPVYGAAGLIGYVGFYQQEKPYVAVVKDGAGIGRTMLLPAKSSVIGTMQYLLPKNRILPEYLKYAVQNMHLEKYYSGATIPHIYFRDYKNEEFSFADMVEQRRVIAVLNKVERIIESRKQQLQKLDELIKARFVEMFGDPEHNNKDWIVKKLNDLCNIGSSKRIYQEELSAEGIPFWRISDLVAMMDTGNVNSSLYIPTSKYEELKVLNLVPQQGDILVTSRGTLGRCYIISQNDCFYFQDGMISWLSNYSDEITPLYIQYLFEMPGFKKQIDGMQAGSTVAYLSIAMLKKLDIMLPNTKLQIDFADFVEQTNKSKAVIQKALDEAQLLFDSLMQKYFG